MVGVWEHMDSWLRAQMCPVLKLNTNAQRMSLLTSIALTVVHLCTELSQLSAQSLKNHRISSESVSSDAWSMRHSRSQRAPKIKQSAQGPWLPPSPVENILPPASWELANAVYANSAGPMPTKNRHGNLRGNAKNAHSKRPAHSSPTLSEFTSDPGLWPDTRLSLHLHHSSNSEPLPSLLNIPIAMGIFCPFCSSEYMCIYIDIYTYMHIYMYIYIFVHIFLYVCMYIYV